MRNIVSFVGWSGTGKTGLLASLIPRLEMEGKTVAAVKKTNHRVAQDREGSDTQLFHSHGCNEVALIGPDAGNIHIYRSLEAEDMLQIFADSTCLLSEGLFFSGYPCIEVLGSRSWEEGPKRSPRDIQAYVLGTTERAPAYAAATKKPIFESADIDTIIGFLEELWHEK